MRVEYTISVFQQTEDILYHFSFQQPVLFGISPPGPINNPYIFTLRFTIYLKQESMFALVAILMAAICAL